MKIIHLIGIERALVLEDDAVLCDDFEMALDIEMAHMNVWKKDPWITVLTNEANKRGTQAYIVKGSVAGKIASEMGEKRVSGLEEFFRRKQADLNIHWTSRDLVSQENKNLMNATPTKFVFEKAMRSHAEISSQSWSQYGEDDIVNAFFKDADPADLMFLEIGALDGVKDSNCRKLALLGWSGVCIEPNPYLFVKLRKNYQGAEGISTLCALVGPDPEIRVLHLNNDGLATSSPLVFNTLRERVYFPSACHVPAVTVVGAAA